MTVLNFRRRSLLLLRLSAWGIIPAMSLLAPQEPPNLLPCQAVDDAGAVSQPICGTTVVWADDKQSGVCPDDPCTFSDFQATIDLCGEDIAQVRFGGNGDWEDLDGAGSWHFDISNTPIVLECGEFATKTTYFKNADGSAAGSKQMVFKCGAPCP